MALNPDDPVYPIIARMQSALDGQVRAELERRKLL